MNDTVTAHKLLVVEDDGDMRGLLLRYLGESGFSVRAVADGGALDRQLQRESFDALILDLMLPGEDGLSILRRLRAGGETLPILVLTARGDPVDRVIGLEIGADDYLAKPFLPRELLARIQALLRRQRRYSLGAAAPTGTTIRFGPFTLEVEARRLMRDAQPVPLTGGEFNLLLALASNPQRPLGRERLIELAYGRDHDANDRSIDVQILRLRRSIEADAANPRYIQTVRGIGYVFVPAGGAS
ncbi:MAG TPA: response regulator [Burkholderiaceae bacterium]|nr:response regulator [Burkholderiaceae bacterium]